VLVPAVVRAFAILEYLATVRPVATLSQIARDLELSKSSCFNILHSLVQLSAVRKDQYPPRYRLGARLIELGHASRRNQSYRELIHAEVRELVDEFSVTCIVAQPIGDQDGIVVIDRVLPNGRGNADIVAPPVGQLFALSAPALGGALLATKSDHELAELLMTSTLSQRPSDDTLSKLETIRQHGYATSCSDYQEGVNAVGAAVQDASGTVALILGLVGPDTTLPASSFAAAGERLRVVADRIGERISMR
jgi:DNA-binding IclR family transcriptional regulator